MIDPNCLKFGYHVNLFQWCQRIFSLPFSHPLTNFCYLPSLLFLLTCLSTSACCSSACLSVRRTHVSGPRRDAADGRLQQSRLSRVLVAHVAMATVQRQLWVRRGRADKGGGVRAGQPEPCQRLQVRLTSFLYWKVVFASSWILCRQRQSWLNRTV